MQSIQWIQVERRSESIEGKDLKKAIRKRELYNAISSLPPKESCSRYYSRETWKQRDLYKRIRHDFLCFPRVINLTFHVAGDNKTIRPHTLFTNRPWGLKDDSCQHMIEQEKKNFCFFFTLVLSDIETFTS